MLSQPGGGVVDLVDWTVVERDVLQPLHRS